MSDLLSRLQAALAGRYRVERELGGGGMSRVFAAEEIGLGRKVVIKVLPEELAAGVSTDRFRREIQLAASLQHPHIVPLLSAGEADGLLYYTMPLVEGESLRQRLAREGELPVADAISILHDLADALSYAHRRGVIHRDIKPDNVLLSNGHAVITDFGVARALAAGNELSGLTGTGLAIGTPAYMAPEQATADPLIDHRADIYALGVLAYEMLAGQPPFSGRSVQALIAAQLTQTPPPLALARASIPAALSAAIMRCLEKRPADRWQSADELLHTLEHPRTSGAIEAIPELPSRPRTALLQRWPVVLLLLCAAIAVPAAGWLVIRQSRESKTLDPNVVAVAPFDVLSPNLSLWREGMVDLLSRNLDGAGSLRSVAPSTVIRRWTGRADPPSAQELGRRTGAGLAVFGQMVPTRADSVRLTATLYDVRAGRSLAELEYRDASGSIDRLTDSLTLGLLRQLNQSRTVGAVRATALRSTSLPALKAFLQGEQLFRRTAWDSALAAYQRAVELDSGFALAWRRMSSVVGWHVIAADSLAEVYGFRAGQLNHGLSPRDSLLITAESLSVAMYRNSEDTLWRSHQARLFATLEQATRSYPEDPEVWYEMGDARLHFRQVGRIGLAETLAPFDRAIAADSAFGLSYIHPVMLAIQLGRPELARRYIAGFLNHLGTDQHGHALRLTDEVLTHPSGRTPELERMVEVATDDVLFTAILALWDWPDSLESAVWLARRMAAGESRGVRLYDARFGSWLYSSNLALRGHLKEAYSVGGDSVTRVAEIAALGAVVPAAKSLFAGWLQAPPIHLGPTAIPFGFNVEIFAALPWWAARRDTISLAGFASRMRLLETQSPADVQPWLRYGAGSAAAYIALARGDTAGALSRFTSLPDTVCPCLYDQIVTSQLLMQAGRGREAAAVFDRQYPPFMSPGEGLWRLQRARALERLGRRDAAIEDYRFTANVWRHADPELQPYVAEARQALARLTAEPQR